MPPKRPPSASGTAHVKSARTIKKGVALKSAVRSSRHSPVPAPSSGRKLRGGSGLLFLSKDSHVWSASETTCFSIGLDPSDPKHTSVICDRCKSFWEDKLSFVTKDHTKKKRTSRHVCEQPWSYGGSYAGKINARDKIYSLCSDDAHAVGSPESNYGSTFLSPLRCELPAGTPGNTDSLSKTKSQGQGAKQIFDESSCMSLYLTSRIIESMSGRTSLLEHEVGLLECLKSVNAKTKDISTQTVKSQQKEISTQTTSQQKEISTQTTSQQKEISTQTTDVLLGGDDHTLYYTYKARAGTICLFRHPELRCRIEHGLLPIPSEINGPKSEGTRLRTTYGLASVGSCQSWIPRTHELTSKNRSKETARAIASVKGLHDLFNGEQHRFGKKALRTMVLCNQFGYGCSDEATIMIVAGTIKAVLQEIGIADITAQNIARGIPSRASIVKAESDLAADCMVKVCAEMIKDRAKHICIITDHGHRKGQDHFVKLIVWFGKDLSGKPTLKHHCVDIDMGGHAAKAAANAVKISTGAMMKLLKLKLGDDVELSKITGDSGGGASVQRLHPALIENRTMNEDSTKLACIMHGLNKPLEIACIDALGKQGIGHKTPWQMIYIFTKLLKTARKECGSKNLNNMWAMTVDKIMNDQTWQEEASLKCKQPFEEFLAKLIELEGSDIDALGKLTSEYLHNVQDPILSRWGTVLATVSIFVENYVVIYFFAVAMKQHSKPKKGISTGRYCYQLACSLISLMNNRSEPTLTGGTIDEYVASFNTFPTLDGENQDGNFLKPGDSPVFLTTLYFVDGFAKAYFNDMFNFMMQDSPCCGKGSGTFGQLAPWGPERCYVMHKKLSELENGGYKHMKEFKQYMTALNGIDDHSEVGQDYFEKVATVFLDRFRLTFEKHVVSQWRSPKTLHYILGGDPHHAQAFARWLVDYEVGEYSFPANQVTLGKHHTMTHGDITVNLRESMDYLTNEIDRTEIVNDRFVMYHWDCITYLAASDTHVDLLGGNIAEPLRPLSEGIWKQVLIHAVHQQRCENYVQLSGLIALTGVGEVRRSCRAVIVSDVIRRFNQWGLDRRNAYLKSKNKTPVKRLQGTQKTQLFLEYADIFFEDVDKAKHELGNDAIQELTGQMGGTDKKASKVERDKALQQFEQDLAVKRTMVAAELPAGVDRTARVGGGIILSLLTGSNGFVPHVHAELRARSIAMSDNEEQTWTLAEKRGKIRQHEYNCRVQSNEDYSRENKSKDITYIVPWSDELKDPSAFEKQQAILDKKAGILALEEDTEG